LVAYRTATLNCWACEEDRANLLFRHEGRNSDPGPERVGISTVGGAIEHSKNLARQMRDNPRASGRAFSIVVIDQSGAEIHREFVAPRSDEGG
jgi:hypothetical protein